MRIIAQAICPANVNEQSMVAKPNNKNLKKITEHTTKDNKCYIF